MHCLDAKLSGVKSGQTVAKMLHGIEDSLFVVKGARSSHLVLSDWLSLPFYVIPLLSYLGARADLILPANQGK